MRSLTFSKESLTCGGGSTDSNVISEPTLKLLMRRPGLTPAHLSDVFHLILKVTGSPLPCHHLLLSVRAHPLHDAVDFGPAMLQRGVRHPIGHVPEVLREDKPSAQVSANSLG